MKLEFDDGSFLQLEKEDGCLNIIQCAKKDRKVIMSSSKITYEQAKKIIEFLNNVLKGNNE